MAKDGVEVKIFGDDSGFKKTLDGLGDAAKTALAGVGTALAAASAAVVKIGKDAVEAYSNYEQLVGGVETLFGTGGQSLEEYAQSLGQSVEKASEKYKVLEKVQDEMVDRAHTAFSRAGVSANTYMETVTSFSASLLQSLGGDTMKAADYADRAIVDMSDNANKMGTDIQMIQNAYQGFARGNFTMLDNLALGYSGSREEMERLISDASKMTDVQEKLGITVDASSLSFGNIVNAISVMQESMGIAGTTAKEAETTIQGSLNMTKAAWENVLIALSDPNGDLETAIDDLIYSAEKFGDNVLPIAEHVLSTMPELISSLGETIIGALPGLVTQLLPEIANTGAQLLDVLVTTLTGNADTIAQTAVSIAMTLLTSLLDNAPKMVQAGLTLITSLANGIAAALPELVPSAIDTILTLVETLLDNADLMIDAALALIIGLAEGIMNALPKLIEKAPEIVIKLVNALVNAAPKLASAAVKLIYILYKGIVESIPTLVKSVPKIVEAIKSTFGALNNIILGIGKGLVQGIWQGILNTKDWLKNNLKKWCNNIKDTIKGWFGIHSPSAVMRDEVGKMLVLGLANGIAENEKTATDAFKNMLDVIDKQKEFEIINEEEYYKKLEKLRDQYLKKGTKEWIEYTQKLYSYQKTAEENAKKELESAYNDFIKLAGSKVEEFKKEQEKFAQKLKDYGGLFEKDAVIGVEYEWSSDGKTLTEKEITGIKPSDFKKQTEELKHYADNLQALKDRADIPQEFFATLKDLSIEDGLEFTNALLDYDDEALNRYIEEWKEKQEAATEISNQLYQDEYEQMKKEIEDEFGELPEKFLEIGGNAGEGFMDGFMQTLSEKLDEARLFIQNQLQSIMPTAAYAGASGGVYNSTNYTTTYVLQPAKGESTTAQLRTIRNAETLNKLRNKGE